MSKHYSYGALLKQRVVVAGLTLGLVTIMTGLFIELTMTSQKNTIDKAVQKLIEPLNPLLDLKTVERLEQYPVITSEVIRSTILPKDVGAVDAATESNIEPPVLEEADSTELDLPVAEDDQTAGEIPPAAEPPGEVVTP